MAADPGDPDPTELNYAVAHEAIAAAVPDRPCILWGDRRFTWADITDRTRRLAAVLGPGRIADERAVDPWESPHRHVALYLINGNEYLEGMLGAWKARWAPVNVNYRYVTDELVHVLGDAEAEAVIFHGRFADTLAEVLPLGRMPKLLQVDDGSGAALLPGAVGYEAALASASPDAPIGCSPGDRYIVYTGGTTGHPKGVLWRQADFIATCLGVTDPVGALVERAGAPGRQPLRALPAPPLMHGAAHWNALSAWLAGGTVVFQQDPGRLDPVDLLDTCERHEATSLLIVGDAFARPLADELHAHPRHLPSLRHLVTGGAILSPAVKAELLDHLPGLRIVDILGSSETGRQGVRSSGGDGRPAPSATFGRSATTVVLSDDRSHELEPGDPELGWLAQRGRVPLGYLHDRARTEATFPVVAGERMAVAGDRARLAPDGSIELHGRDSGTVNSGGEKIFAEEVELALKHHPAVYDVLVVGRPSDRWGQELVAVVALRPGMDATDEELRATCEPYLARYKWPKAFVRVDRVERSPSGKPDYRWAGEQVTATVDPE